MMARSVENTIRPERTPNMAITDYTLEDLLEKAAVAIEENPEALEKIASSLVFVLSGIVARRGIRKGLVLFGVDAAVAKKVPSLVGGVAFIAAANAFTAKRLYDGMYADAKN